MGVVTGITRRLEVPGEDGAHITIRMLSWLTLDRARKAKLADLTDQMRALSGIELPKSDATVATDPFASYDRLTLLKAGITEWSYGTDVAPEELDDRTAEWAAREILDLSVPTDASTRPTSLRSTGTSEATGS